MFDDSGEFLAVVNDKIVGEGELVNGAQVTEIKDGTVRFNYRGRDFVKSVGQGCEKVFNKGRSSIDTKDKSFGQIFKDKAWGQSQCSLEGERIKEFISQHQDKIIIIFIVLAVVFLLMYIYVAIVLQMIAIKTDTSSSWLAWIPIANFYLMCKIANRAGWFFLIIFLSIIIGIGGAMLSIPRQIVDIVGSIVGFIFGILIWVKIAEARNKPAWIGLLIAIITPICIIGIIVWAIITNSYDIPVSLGVIAVSWIISFIIMGYLAFSNGAAENKAYSDIPQAEKKKEEIKDDKKDNDKTEGDNKGDSQPLPPPFRL